VEFAGDVAADDGEAFTSRTALTHLDAPGNDNDIILRRLKLTLDDASAPVEPQMPLGPHHGFHLHGRWFEAGVDCNWRVNGQPIRGEAR
jgi:hypothetical protein